jgi:hypothetical protein
VSEEDAARGDGLLPVPRISELPFDRLVLDWRGARDRAESYAKALGIDPAAGAALARRALERAVSGEGRGGARGARGDSLDSLAEILVEEAGAGGADRASKGEAFEGWRLGAWWVGAGRRVAPPRVAPPQPFAATPPLTRRPMPQAPLLGGRSVADALPTRGRRRAPWARASRRRRILLGFLVLIPTVIASGFMLEVLPYQGRTALELVIALLFGALFGWISIGFWTAFAGFALLLRGGDRYVITRTDTAGAGPIDPASRTAIVMPICEEDVKRVYTGLDVIQSELERRSRTSTSSC